MVIQDAAAAPAKASPARKDGDAARRGASDGLVASGSLAASDGFAPIMSGALEVRLARTLAEVEAAQHLRYRVFYEEMGAHPCPETATLKRDFDRFDAAADHLLVIDRARICTRTRTRARTRARAGDRDPVAVVGAYRLLRRQIAERAGGFYTAGEYDLGPLRAVPGEIMELGRTCVAADRRSGAVMQALWKGLAAYVSRHDIRLMFGCASFPGSTASHHAAALDYLYRHHLAPPAFRPRALSHLHIDMRGKEAVSPAATPARPPLPPLLKGYLRLGGWVGEGAVADRQFNTTDVCIVLPTDAIPDRYYEHYGRSKADPDMRGL